MVEITVTVAAISVTRRRFVCFDDVAVIVVVIVRRGDVFDQFFIFQPQSA
jgi:hypothetical protein